MARFYALAERPVTEEGFGLPPGTIGAVDLAPVGAQSPVFVTSDAPFAAADVLVQIGDGTTLDSYKLSNAERSGWETHTGVPVSPQTTLLDVLWGNLTEHADPEGILRAKPLMPTSEGVLELHLGGHSRVRAERLPDDPTTHPAWGNIQRVLQNNYRALQARDRTLARKWLGAQRLKYKLSPERARDLIVPSDLPQVLPLPPTTTISDAFTDSNGTTLENHTPTDGGSWSWNDQGDATDIQSNQASGGTRSYGRAETDLSSEDHTATFTLTSGVGGARTRCPSTGDTDRTSYFGRAEDVGDAAKIFRLDSFGSATEIGTASLTITPPVVCKLESDGSSHTLSIDGTVEVGPVTDTNLTNLRTGFGLWNSGAGDDFEAADLVAGAQFARPDSDVANPGGWTTTPLWSKIDEVTADDATTEVISPNKPSNDAFEVGLSNVTDPTSSADHVLRVRWRADNPSGVQIDMTCNLLQGTTTIATISVTNIGATYQTDTLTLSAAEADSITDYSDLRIEVSAQTVGGGANNNAVVTWAEFEVPAAVTAPSGAGDQTLEELAQAGVGALPPEGAGASVFAAISQAASGVEELPGVAAQDLAETAQAGDGALQPEGAGAQALEDIAQAGVATALIPGDGAQLLSTLAQAGTGAVSDVDELGWEPVYDVPALFVPFAPEGEYVTDVAVFEEDVAASGIGAQTLAQIAQAGTGAEELIATGASTLAEIAQAAAGLETFTATGDSAFQVVGQAGAGVQTIEATGASAFDPLAQAGVGVEAFIGTAAQSLAETAQSATGLMHPEGEADQALATVEQIGTGAERFIGASDQALAAPTQAGTGAHDENITGQGASVLSPFAQSGTGVGGAVGEAAQSLTDVAQAGTGAETIIATAEQNLVTPAQDGSGVMQPEGAGDQALEQAAQLGSGATGDTTAAGAQELATAEQAGSGFEHPRGEAAQALATLDQAGSGVEIITGTASQALQEPAQAGTGAQAEDTAGAGAQVLASPQQAATGAEIVSGTASQALATVEQEGTGREIAIATADQLLAGLAQNAVGIEIVAGTGVSGLERLAQSGAGTEAISGLAAQVLAGLDQSGIGVEIMDGQGAQLLRALTQDAAGALAADAAGAQTLERLTQSADGFVPIAGIGDQTLELLAQLGAGDATGGTSPDVEIAGTWRTCAKAGAWSTHEISGRFR